jgi:hypothetical protein
MGKYRTEGIGIDKNVQFLSPKDGYPTAMFVFPLLAITELLQQ